MQYRITTGTVTYAIKARDLLRRNGYKVRMERSPASEKTAGCGYGIVINERVVRAEELLRGANVKILSIDEIS